MDLTDLNLNNTSTENIALNQNELENNVENSPELNG